MKPGSGRHALTVDLEDWHQLIHKRLTGVTIPPTTAVIRSTNRLLDLLDEWGIRATFFVLGNVTETYPALVREVAERGHDVGSHTHSHDLVFRSTPEDFRRDMVRSKSGLENLTGRAVEGFRAPEFSVQRLDHWSFRVLAELGFKYDSSVFPLPGARYGIPEAPRVPFDINTAAGTLREYPLATWDAGRFRLPVAGGSYFRLLPAAVLRRGMRAIAAAGGTTVLYVHPYEFHRGLLKPLSGGWEKVKPARLPFAVSRVALHNYRTGAVAQRIRSLTQEFQFMTLKDIYELDGLASATSVSRA